VPSVARGTIFNGTLNEFKYSNYDLIKIESLIKQKHKILLKLFLFLDQINVFQWLLYIKIWWAWVGWHDE